MNVWPVIKIALIVIATIGAISDVSSTAVGEEIGWSAVITGFLFFPAIVLVGLFVLKIILRRQLDFEVPNWRSNPLNFSHPEHFFHLGGMVMSISGICGLVTAYFKSKILSPALFISPALGVGILIGIWVLKMVHDKQSTASNNVL